MRSRFEQSHITQIISDYSPNNAPKLPLDFGDFLSLVWRIDRHADNPQKVKYYKRGALALAKGLGIKNQSLLHLIQTTPPGKICEQITNLPYRSRERLVDAQDRKAALTELLLIRHHILSMSISQDNWGARWPGSGIVDDALRERVFATLFTAFQGQLSNFARLLLVVDIVLANLILGVECEEEVNLTTLIFHYDFPDPQNNKVREDFYSVQPEKS